MTNKEYSQRIEFTDLCKQANVKPTIRQASKFRRKEGAVYKRYIFGNNSVIHVPDCAKIDITAS